MKLRLPHPLLLLLAAVALAAVATWVLPAGEYERRDDPATGRRVVVPGTYERVDAAPLGVFAALVAVPRGVVDAAEVVAVILFVGGAWVVVDRVGTLGRLVARLVALFHGRGLYAIPVISLFFAAMGALENMQEEIIPLVPVLLVLGAGLGVDAVTVVAMSAGAAMIGSAFGPTNPFQAGIAMKLAQLPPGTALGTRTALLLVAVAVWVGWTLRHALRARRAAAQHPRSRGGGSPAADGAVRPASRGAAAATLGTSTVTRSPSSPPKPPVARQSAAPETSAAPARPPSPARDLLILAIAVAPILAYVYGALALEWGFNELSAGFLVAGFAAGLLGGLSLGATVDAYLEGMQGLVVPSILVGVARSISLVLADGHVIDTILRALASPLESSPPLFAALLMIPLHFVVHLAVPSVSGHAVLTLPLLVPLSDLLGIARQVTVLAYQTGAGLTELLTPTNGALMAVLLAAGVPFGRWLRFALGGVLLALAVGVAGMAVLAGGGG